MRMLGFEPLTNKSYMILKMIGVGYFCLTSCIVLVNVSGSSIFEHKKKITVSKPP